MSELRTWGLDWLERVAKMIGTIAVLVAALSFLVPSIGTALNILTAWRFGVIRHVYYEIGENRSLTDPGQLYLLRPGSGDFAGLAFGDKLQANSEIVFHESDDKDSPTIFLLQRGDCVVIARRDREVIVQKARSGGWLTVATPACGLFRCGNCRELVAQSYPSVFPRRAGQPFKLVCQGDHRSLSASSEVPQ